VLSSLRTGIRPTVGPLSIISHGATQIGPTGTLVGSQRWINPYWRKKGWFPWRRMFCRAKSRAAFRRRNILPRYSKEGEAPAGVDSKSGCTWSFTVKGLKLSVRNLKMYSRLIRGLHVQDALDWLAALPVVRINPIFRLLRKSRDACIHQFQADGGRLYVGAVEVQVDTPVKYMTFWRRRFGVVRSWRNKLKITLREATTAEMFHRLYILGQVPRSLSMDMRLALQESKASKAMIREWHPYLTALTRRLHRKDLQWRDGTRQFDYYESRREWSDRYNANIVRRWKELRSERGLQIPENPGPE